MRRVVKVGGSLLSRGDFAEALLQWIAKQPPAQTLVVIGGGNLIDAIRQLDRIHPGDPVEVHWRCVDLLQVTFELVSGWIAQWPKIDSAEQLSAELDLPGEPDGPVIVSVRSFYGRDSKVDLPLDWSTTADSIAAALAIGVDADELVLLKSCEIADPLDLRDAFRREIIDEALLALAARVRSIRMESLSDANVIH